MIISKNIVSQFSKRSFQNGNPNGPFNPYNPTHTPHFHLKSTYRVPEYQNLEDLSQISIVQLESNLINCLKYNSKNSSAT